VLLKNILQERGHDVEMYDPYVDTGLPVPNYPTSIFVIGTKHPDFVNFNFPEGSIVIDALHSRSGRTASRQCRPHDIKRKSSH